ncbi:MAG TPA: mechanosensitive ion channel protein MscS [Rikenellaceae bacterium]|nr:mechanosensitive ion channel protein MscS [Rikenellaceae bacterium]HCZ22147.1 mechanosensitive ion channel protein MscS [Rikenellaceae bacterium]
MKFTILQTPVISEEDIISKADSAKVSIEQFASNLATDPNTTLHNLLDDVIRFGIKVLLAILIYVVGAWLIKHIRKLLSRWFVKRSTDKTLSSFVLSLVSITLTIILIIITISTLGVNTTSLAALLAAGGMAIGMAMSGTVQNFAGGIMILAFKPFKAGDFIEAQGYSGTVSSVSIVSTSLVTPDNKSIIIPNGALFNGNINNYSRNPIRRVEWLVSVEYGTDATVCAARLTEIMKADPRVLDSSTKGASDPVVVLSQLADSAVVFSARAWVKTSDYWDVYFKLNMDIYTELPKSGIEFPYPQLDVHVHDDKSVS